MSLLPEAPLRLLLDSAALKGNWRWLAAESGGAACGAAVKANGYGLGAAEVVRHLIGAGCRDFFVATWAEAQALHPHLGGASMSVLHGVRGEDMPLALTLPARPVLNSVEQIARWKAAGGGLCDIMIDTGMNRLGLRPEDVSSALLAGLDIDVVMSHLACADEDSPMNARQRNDFLAITKSVNARRFSLANSAGILLGRDYLFDLTRPGLALYGGEPRHEAEGKVQQVVRPQAQILQRRTVRAGESVGYGAIWAAATDTEVAVLNIGYADGYFRGFSGSGQAMADDGTMLPLIGRVSMDLVAVDVTNRPTLREGEWLELALALPEAARASGMSQYELLTGLGQRFDRRWI